MQTTERKSFPPPPPPAPSPLFTDPPPRQPAGGPPPRLEAVERAVHEHAQWVDAVRHQMAQVIVGQRPGRSAAGRPAGGRPRPAGGRARGWPRRCRSRRWRRDRGNVPAHPVHARPAARRHRRHADLQPAATATSRPSKGPVFANFVLADEINRAPAKVQSALLEAMQERQVTIGDETYPLAEPFLVLATQNPIEQEGTYPLPEAQVDRFMLKVNVGYPSRERGARDPGAHGRPAPAAGRPPVVSLEEIRGGAPARSTRSTSTTRSSDYIVDLVLATRDPRGATAVDLARLHPVRRLAARHHRPHAGGPGAGLPARPRLRHAAGREGDRATTCCATA